VTPEVARAATRPRADAMPRDVGIALDLRPHYVVLPIKDRIYRRFLDSEFPYYYDPIGRFQQDGRSEVVLESDPSGEYAQRGHFVADFILFRRVEGLR